ncbi:MAG: AAA family ATPase, partial [Candidatus Binatus sp.]
MGGKQEAAERGAQQNAFIGRTRELSELRAALEESVAGRGGCFLISGEPGIGKTRLADELAADAALRGVRVAWGRCWEGGGAPAYWPWVEIIRSLVLEPGRARNQQAAVPPEIGQLIPELAAEATQQRTSSDPEQGRFRLFDAVATLVRQVARTTPVVVILDDLHEADRGSLELLKFVARGLTDSRVVIVGTYRDAEVRRSPYLAESISEIVRHGHPMPLAGLAENEVARMIEQRAERSPSATFASELHRVTAGNPLFVDGVIRVLVAERKLGTAEHLDLSGFKLPEGVRGAIRKRLAMLSTEARSALAVAAVIGQEFDVVLLERVHEDSAGTLAELMREAAEVGIVAAPSRATYRFTHALIREALYDELTANQRIDSHRDIGAAIEEIYKDHLKPHQAALAHHFRAAGIAKKAIDYSIGAGEAAAEVFAYEEARSHFEAALELLDGQIDSPERRASLSLRLAAICSAIDYGAAIRHAEAALSLYIGLGDAGKVARSHAQLGTFYSLIGEPTSDIPLAREHFRKAEALLSKEPEGKALARLYIGIAQTSYTSRGTQREGLAAGKRAMEIAERFDDDLLWAYAAVQYGLLLLGPGLLADSRALLERAWQIADRLNDARAAFMATWTGGGCGHYFHDSPEALRWYQRELSKPRVTQAPHFRRTLHMLLGEALARAGDLAGARRLYTGATHTQILARQLFYEGRWDEAEAAIEDQMPKLRNFGDLASLAACLEILANICRLSGRPQKALALFKEYFATAGSEIAVVNEILVRPIIASICVQIGHLDAAERELVRCREIMALGEDWRGLAGFVVCAEAVVAAATGKCEEAEAQFEKAVDIFRRYQVPFEEAEALHYWGRALNAAGEQGRANEKFDAALELYRHHGGGQRWIDRVEAARIELRDTAAPLSDQRLPDNECLFRREGEYWTVGYGGVTCRLKDMKGLGYIAHLIAHPGHRIHVLDL